VFTEDMQSQESPPTGYAKDAIEVEAYLRGFARRRSDVATTVLRMVSVLGTGSESALYRYLAPAVVPSALGFDPRIQVLHELDAVETLRLATVSARPGVFNVAGDGAMPLSQLLRRTGRAHVALPRPMLPLAASLTGNSGLLDLVAEDCGFLHYGRAVDTTRLHSEFGYQPRFTTAEAVQSSLGFPQRLPRLTPLALGVGSQLLAARRADRLASTGSR
jgi:UDP-glucose 4-epimerase